MTRSDLWFPIPDWQEETPSVDASTIFPPLVLAEPGCAALDCALPDLGRVVIVGLSAVLGLGVIATALGWWTLRKLRLWRHGSD